MGRSYVFENLEEYINKQENKGETIMMLALLLGSKSVVSFVSWDKLRISFFEKYCQDLLRCYGYDPVKPLGKWLMIYNQEFMTVFFAEMKQSGMLNDYTYEELAEHLYETGHFTWGASTICHKLKTLGYYSPYTPVIQKFIKDIRKMDKNK